jgi:hypothetical protein
MDIDTKYHKNSISNHYKKIMSSTAKSDVYYKPTQKDLAYFNYTNTFPNLKAKDSRDWIEKASIYLGQELEVLKSQKGWSVTPCNACSTTITGSLAKDITNKQLCVNSSLQSKTWKCPEGYSFYSVMARDYNTTDWSKMYNLVKSAPNKIQYDPIKVFAQKLKKEGVSAIFEALRKALTSVAGAAAQVIIDFFGGGIAVEIVWMILLGWDAYQITQGNFNLVNLLTDIAGIVTFGPGGKWLWDKMTVLSVEGGEITLTRFGEWLKSEPRVVSYFKNYNFDSVFKKTLGNAIKYMEKDAILSEFVVSLRNIYQKLLPYIEQLSGKEIVQATEKGVEKVIMKSGGKVTKELGKDIYDYGSDLEQQAAGTNYLASNRDNISKASKYVDKSSTLSGKIFTTK